MGSKKRKKKPAPRKPKNGKPEPDPGTEFFPTPRRSIMISFKVTPEEHEEILSRSKTKYDGAIKTKSELYRRELGLTA